MRRLLNRLLGRSARHRRVPLTADDLRRKTEQARRVTAETDAGLTRRGLQ